MICVSLGRARHKRMIAEHKYLVEQGAQLVELRLDYIGRAVNLGRLLQDRPGPVVVTVRRREDGGRWMKSEEERQMLLRTAIAAGVEYVDLESDVAELIPRYGKTKRIVSFHEMNVTPENLDRLHQAMADKDADIVKIATMANTFTDNVRMVNLVKSASVPTIGICMGEIGVITRLLANRLGSPFTYAMFSGKELAPGQLSFKDMRDLYRYDEIDDKTQFFGVIADPVAHSYSPLVHNRAFQHQGINARYVPFRVPRNDLHSFMEHCREFGVAGLSVTIPHKVDAMEFCTRAEAGASGIGAVNTLVFDGKDCFGYNTDYRAAMDCLENLLGVDRRAERPMEGVTALVLGAGGVSRAIAWGLKQRYAEVIISSRTYERAQLLAGELGCRAIEWELRYEPKINLLVNGTPIGMHPDLDGMPYKAEKLSEYLSVFDTVYNPENTMLVKSARRAQSPVATGIDMFVRQAAYQYKLFTGKDAPVELMRKTIKDATNPAQLN
jgi:3-dehydroquinate dehydratase/shikimate dehydrogenase